MVCELVFPVTTVPNPAVDGVKLNPACTPLPFNVTVAGEFGALLTIETDPVALPTACGAYCALKLALCPGAIASGKVIPLTLKPVPVAATCETVKLAEPLFVN